MAHLDGTLLDQLWDFSDPAASEHRLREVAATAEGLAVDELRTQIARAMGLQDKFAEALTLLDGISSDDSVVQQRIALERGRVHNATDDVANAITQFQQAYRLAADPFITVDAIHMLAMTDIAHAATWYEQGLQIAHASTDPRVQRWAGSLRNNYAWHLVDTDDLPAALIAFQETEEWIRQHGNANQLHVARWSVAHVLRRLGQREEARQILLELKANDPPDSYVIEELALLGG